MSHCVVAADLSADQLGLSRVCLSAATVVIIDSTVDEVAKLAEGVVDGADVHILKPEQDGIAQITEILQSYGARADQWVNALHIISHGSPGSLSLGSARLSLSTLEQYRAQLQSWFVASSAEILLYGCQVALGDAGAEFLEKLQRLTGASVAASRTLVGHSAHGGNWTLDVQVGAIAAPLAIQADVMAHYPGVLAEVTSIVRQNPLSSATNADSVVFYVNFSEAVQNVDDGDFVLSGAGSTGGSISSVVAVSASQYAITVTGIANNNGELTLALNASNDITDLLSAGLTSSTPTTSESYTLDNDAPTLLSFVRQSPVGADTNADLLVFRATFSEAVVNVDAFDFVITGTTASILGVSPVNGVPNAYDISIAGGNLTSLPSGVVGIDLATNSSIRDQVGNLLVVAEPAPDQDQTYNVDNTPATVVSIASTTANGRYRAGDVITLEVTFSELVTVTGSPQLVLETGTVDAIATYVGVSATNPNAHVFSYTVQDGHTSPDLSYQSTVALNLNGATIQDTAGNNAILTLPTPGTTNSLSASSDLVIDTAAPSLVSFLRLTPAGAITNATSLTFQVTFSEDVQGVTLEDFVVTGSTATVSGITPVSGSVYNVTISGGDLGTLNGEVGLDLASGQDIIDLARNALPSTQPTVDQTYTIDTTAPTVVGVSSPTANGRYNQGDQIQITVQFSETVTVTGTPQLLLANGGAGATATYTGGSGTNILTFTYTVGAGDTNNDLDYVDTSSLVLNGGAIQDVAGNSATLTLPAPGTTNSLGASKDLWVDTTAPSLVSITRQTPLVGTTNADSLTFRVTFDEAVQSLDVSDFVVNGSTAAIASVVPFGVGGTVYDVTVSGGDLTSFNGTVGLNLAAGQNISDLAGNALPAGEPADPNDEVYVLDNVLPTVVSVDSTTTDGRYNAGDTITITVQFSEIVNVTGIPQLLLETGTNDRIATYSGGTGTDTLTFTYTVQAGDTSADLDYRTNTALTLNGGTLRDEAGNNATLTLAAPGATNSLGANRALVIDTSTPTLSSIIRLTPATAATNADSVVFRVTFSEDMLGVSPEDFVVTGTTATIASVAPVGPSTSVYDVTVSGGNLATLNGVVGLNLAAGQNITDAAGNALPTTEPTTDQTYTIDNIAPTVVSVTSPTANGRYNAGDTIAITIQFSEVVNVTGVPQLVLETGASDRTLNYTSGSGTNTLTFTYTVQPGDTNADLDYLSTAALTGTIVDAAGNAANLILPSPGAANSLGANKDLVIDTTAPGFTSITRQTPLVSPTNADSLVFRVTFNEAMQGVDVSDFVVSGTGLTATVSTVTPVLGTGGTVYDVTVSGGNLANFNGEVGLNLAAGQNMTDLAGNALPGIEPASDETYTLDNAAPTVVSVTSPTADARYNAGDVIEITVTFSEAVTVTGTPQLILETGATDAIAQYTSGSGTDTLTFLYTVGAGENSADLDYRSTVALVLNGGAVRDASGNNANLTLATPGTTNSLGDSKALIVDTVAPTVTAIERQTPAVELTNATSLTFRVTLSEDVQNLNAADFVVNGSSATVTNVAAVDGSNRIFDVTVSGGDLATFNGTVGLNLAPDQDIADLAGNQLPLTEPSTDQTYILDHTLPTILSVTSSETDGRYNAGDTIAITLTFSEAITVTGAPQLTLETGTTDAVATYTGGSGTHTLTFTYTVAAGETSADLDYVSTTALALNGGTLTDAAGNAVDLTLAAPGTANSLGGTKDLIIDTTAPTLTAITRQDPIVTPNNADSLTFRVTFDEAVQGVDEADFAVNGTTTATVSGVTRISDTVYDVTVSGGNLATFNGTVGLDLAAGQNMTDLAGNALPTTEPAADSDETYTLDNAAATVVSVTSSTADGRYTVGAVVVITVEFSEVVNVTGSPQLTLETGDTDAIAEYTGGDGTTTLTFTYTVGTGQNSADLDYVSTSALALNGGTIQDTSGNNADLTLPAPGTPTTSLGGSKDVIIDTTPPGLSAIARQDSAPTLTHSDSLVFTITFSEVVQGVDAADFTVNGTTTATVSTVEGSGSTYTVTVSGGDLATFNGTVGLNLAGSQNITDLAGNALPDGEPTPDETYTLDNILPTILGVNSTTADGTYNGGDTIAITVQFSEVVNVTGTPNLTLETGTTDAVATYTSGSGSNTLVFTYTVGAGHSTTDLDYVGTDSLTLNGGAIADGAGNNAVLTLPATGAGNSLGANRNLIVDTTAPTLTAITRQEPTDELTQANSLTFRVSFSEAVTGLTADDFVVSGGSTATISNVTSLGVSVYDITVSGGDLSTFTGTVGLNLATGQTIADGAGNALATAEPTTDETYTLDNSGPTVQVVSSGAEDGSYQIGEVIDITVQFSEVVTVTGAPQLTLETGTTDAVAEYLSGSGTNTLVFRYTVREGHATEDLDYLSNSSLALNGGTLVDASGNEAVLTLPEPGSPNSLGGRKDILLDSAAPRLQAIARQTPATEVTHADSLVFRLRFSEAVRNVDASDFEVNSTSTATITGITAVSASVYDVTVAGGDLATFNGTVGLNLLAGNNITDRVSNALVGGEPTVDAVYILDNSAPRVTSIVRKLPTTPLTRSSSVVFTVSFSEAVNSLDVSDFTLDRTGTAQGTIAAVSATQGNQVDVTVNQISGYGYLSLDVPANATVADAAGNSLASGFTAGQVYLADRVAPRASIVPVIPALQDARMNAPTGQLVIRFNEAVQGLDKRDLILVRNGVALNLANATLTASATRTTYALGNLAALTAPAGNYALVLRAAGSGIVDNAGNGLALNSVTSWRRGVTALGQAPIPFASGAFGRRYPGQPGNESIRGTAIRDELYGGDGNDTIYGLDGDDILSGSNGQDIVYGGNGNDRIVEGAGNDVLYGQDGRDFLFGNTGNDILSGGTGDDILNGGLGADVLLGGTGNDIFRFNSLAERGDVIRDFQVGRDVIDLSLMFQDARYRQGSRFARFAQYVQLQASGTSTLVQIDSDGVGSGRNFLTLATVQNVRPGQLSSNHFLIV